jgi:DNA-binding transcriptional MocR family regulator
VATPARRPTAASRAVEPVRDLRLSRFAAGLAPVPRRTTPERDAIDLSAPGTDDTLFPFDVWHRLVRRHLRRSSRRAAPPSDAAGHDGLRAASR